MSNRSFAEAGPLTHSPMNATREGEQGDFCGALLSAASALGYHPATLAQGFARAEPISTFDSARSLAGLPRRGRHAIASRIASCRFGRTARSVIALPILPKSTRPSPVPRTPSFIGTTTTRSLAVASRSWYCCSGSDTLRAWRGCSAIATNGTCRWRTSSLTLSTRHAADPGRAIERLYRRHPEWQRSLVPDRLSRPDRLHDWLALRYGVRRFAPSPPGFA